MEPPAAEACAPFMKAAAAAVSSERAFIFLRSLRHQGMKRETKMKTRLRIAREEKIVAR